MTLLETTSKQIYNSIPKQTRNIPIFTFGTTFYKCANNRDCKNSLHNKTRQKHTHFYLFIGNEFMNFQESRFYVCTHIHIHTYVEGEATTKPTITTVFTEANALQVQTHAPNRPQRSSTGRFSTGRFIRESTGIQWYVVVCTVRFGERKKTGKLLVWAARPVSLCSLVLLLPTAKTCLTRPWLDQTKADQTHWRDQHLGLDALLSTGLDSDSDPEV